MARFESRRIARRVDYLMRAAGIEAPDGSRPRSVARASALAGPDSRSVHESEALTPAERGNGRDHEVERSLAALAGIRAVREPDS